MVTEDGEILADIPAPIYWKTPYNHDTLAEAKRTALYCTDESKAQQHLANEVDINTIVDRFLKSGTMPQIPLPPTYEEWDEVFDFQTALNKINEGKNAFGMLPAEIRDAFHNDPARFVNQIDTWRNEADPEQREKNYEVMRAMQLALPKGPIADQTTLGDVLKAIKEQGAPKAPPVA